MEVTQEDRNQRYDNVSNYASESDLPKEGMQLLEDSYDTELFMTAPRHSERNLNGFHFYTFLQKPLSMETTGLPVVMANRIFSQGGFKVAKHFILT